MKKCAVVLAVAVLFIFAVVVSVFANDIVWDDIGRGNLNLRTVMISPDSPQIIYVGSTNAVFKSEDGAGSWKNILLIKGQNKAVNFLLFEPTDKNSLYAATGNGLFYSSNQGKDWKRIFRGKNYLENECTTLAVLPYGIYLGTKGGLFVSKDKGRSWHKETAELGSSQILAIAYSLKEPNCPERSDSGSVSSGSRSNTLQNSDIRDIYVACVDGVFKSKDSGQSWERTFITQPQEFGNETEEIAEDQDEAERFSNLRYISIDPDNANYLYLATSRGVYISQDKGQNWESLTSFGLLNRDVRFLLVSSESRLYALTKSGIFEYKGERWQELSFRLAAGDIKSLALDNRNNLYAACDRGLFKAKIRDFNEDIQANTIALYNKDEPQIGKVQQAAIKYAQVIDPRRIENLRRQARIKAILPEVALDYDRTVTSYNYNGTSRFTVGPADWGISLKWSLSDLIWSEQQRLIDGQVRLMVQLREDVLDEVTKLYFERIRVKMELDNLSIEDRKKRFEKELKLQELTAQLDGLTGGYFSQQLKPAKSSS